MTKKSRKKYYNISKAVMKLMMLKCFPAFFEAISLNKGYLSEEVIRIIVNLLMCHGKAFWVHFPETESKWL